MECSNCGTEMVPGDREAKRLPGTGELISVVVEDEDHLNCPTCGTVYCKVLKVWQDG